MSESIPDPVAGMDQALRAMVELARALKAHFDACADQGFSEDQALRLTVAWQAAMLRRGPEEA